MNKNMSRPARVTAVLTTYLVFAIVFLLVAYPLVWMFFTSLKQRNTIFTNLFGPPAPITFENYINAWMTGNFRVYFVNSILVTVPSLILIVLVSALAGYAFARFRFRGSRALFVFMLIGVMVPPQAIIISAFLIVSRLGLIDSYLSLIFTYLSWSPIGIFILTAFFRTIPNEIEEAARIDGASSLQIFWHIAIPLARPALATVSIFYFVWIWNDFLYPLLYLQSEAKNTIPLGLMLFKGRYQVDWGMQTAALSIAVFVPLICYMLFQDKFVKGLTAGAIKG